MIAVDLGSATPTQAMGSHAVEVRCSHDETRWNDYQRVADALHAAAMIYPRTSFWTSG